MLGRKLTPGEVAILETFVVPNYLTAFGELTLDLMLTGDVARIVHLGCRTGYPDRQLLESVTNCSIVGLDSSLAAVELARNKAATLHDVALDYRVATDLPTPLDPESFSHAMSLHPFGGDEDRLALFGEMQRLLYPGGQALVALPLRGSFQEVGDLFREFALKNDEGDLGKAVEHAIMSRPTMETLTEELEAAGLEDVDVEVKTETLSFESGRAFVEDPVTRLLIVPDLEAHLGTSELDAAFSYVSDAIDKYWAHRKFRLSVNIGAASARRN